MEVLVHDCGCIVEERVLRATETAPEEWYLWCPVHGEVSESECTREERYVWREEDDL